ncbi:hypothetical protein CZ787_00360 [Halomonas citrativorans]|uniref:Uncharacterized protein n=1 Tax=Halomonas citrativorans TaxID=2742612 RepID=A0A1R4HN09_9GAMM|nr:hypothetical protein [Halomonas citrativorans]SJN08928.1 hypothetical protein CZ787_00360 [Halomonas citrativorans]
MSGEEQKPEEHPQLNPLQKLNGSVQRYDQPFEPVGAQDWEAVLLDGLTPETAHADELAIPSLKELGEDKSER